MPKFRSLFEMPQIDTSYTKQNNSLSENPDKIGEKISQTSTGHDVHHRQLMYPDGRKVRHFYAVDPDSGDTHMHLTTNFDGKEYSVDDLKGRKNSTIKAHQFYHHVITNHIKRLVSDSYQSPGGAKTWERLKDNPDIDIKLRAPDGSETDLDRSWENNFNNKRSVFVARVNKSP